MDSLLHSNGSVLKDPGDIIKGIGRMFYLINPKETVFEKEEEVPNFYVQIGTINPALTSRMGSLPASTRANPAPCNTGARLWAAGIVALVVYVIVSMNTRTSQAVGETMMMLKLPQAASSDSSLFCGFCLYRYSDPSRLYTSSWPYFFMFMILEHIVLKLEGKKGIRLNDGITSLSNGIFLEGGRLIWRGAESYAYTWIFSNWRLVDLPWDRTSTWIIAAIGVDFGYYWMHRACHEIHVLWAQHQVHHTSEDFNMGVGIRQSILQGWCGFIFYLPLAVVIPPAQFIMHHQFSYLYMFWIHTESIKTLGPLEYILNTPSHHRIHHGSNPYCIDVNYGGVLIIWDKLFGTFRPEMEGDRIVYGLIYQQPSFNPLHLQTFYTKYVVTRYKSYENWLHKLRAVLDRPSWKPGYSVRFKDMKEDPAIHLRPKYNVVLPTWCTVYLLLHYSLVLTGFYQLFLMHLVLPQSTVVILVIYILLSLSVFGMILDASPKAPLYEALRCTALLILARSLTPVFTLNYIIETLYVVSGLFWLLFVCKTSEIKALKQGGN